MNKITLIVFLIAGLAVTSVQAQNSKQTSTATSDLGKLIFEDDFERSESQEDTDEPGNGWKTNSKNRAENDKQVDLKDGAMHIMISEKANHGVSVTHEVEFTDGTVQLRFRLDSPKDSLGLNFADLKFKEVHAGHLCKATVSGKGLALEDLKTGKMEKSFYTARKAGEATEEMQKMVRKKTKRFKTPVPTGQWHDLSVTIVGDTMSVLINGQETGSFSSEGIAHAPKRMLRLAVPKNASVDDLKIYKKK